MGGFFSPDSRLSQLLAAFSTLVLANLAFIGLLLPVISGGVGLLFLFAVALNYFREGTVSWSKVWRTCRLGWKSATAWWFFNLLFVFTVAWEWKVVSQLSTREMRIFGGAWLILALFLVGMINVWTWPQLVRRFEAEGAKSKKASFPEILTLSVRLGFSRLLRTIFALVVLVAPVLGALFINGLFWTVVGWMLILGCSFGTYLVILLVGQPLGFAPEVGGEA